MEKSWHFVGVFLKKGQRERALLPHFKRSNQAKEQTRQVAGRAVGRDADRRRDRARLQSRTAYRPLPLKPAAITPRLLLPGWGRLRSPPLVMKLPHSPGLRACDPLGAYLIYQLLTESIEKVVAFIAQSAQNATNQNQLLLPPAACSSVDAR